MLKIGNIRCDDLVKACGSPLYVYDEKQIDTKLMEYTSEFKSGNFDTEIIYASKAFTCKAMLKKLETFNVSLDVVSGGELYVAEKVGFDASKIYFHGNNKTQEELKMALSYGVKTIVIDNMYEIDKLIKLSEEMKVHVHALIRINPKVEAHTHEYIMTASSDSKFGISIDLKDEIVEIIKKIQASSFVTYDGVHSHIGSQIFEKDGFVGAIQKAVKFIAELKNQYSIQSDVLNIGGGFGVRYTEADTPMKTTSLCKELIQAIEDVCKEEQVSLKKVCMEPGRSIVGEAGHTLYTVGFTKKTQNKEFVFVDGGMADNIRPALYEAEYACDIANKIQEAKTYTYEIAGKCCESGDILIHNAKLPEVETDDLLVMYTTGAYGYSMASNYNRLNRPAVVFVNEGAAKVVIKRETYEEQMKLDDEEAITI